VTHAARLMEFMAGAALQKVDERNMGSVLSHREQLVKLEEMWEIEKCKTEELIPGKAFYVRHLLSGEECKRFRDLMELNSEKVEELGSSEESYQYRKRLVCPQQVAMDQLWSRLQGVMEVEGLLQLKGLNGRDWTAMGLNEMVRVARYGLGGRFAPHCDSSFTRSAYERSWWTVNMYLNTVPAEAEGATVFLSKSHNGITVQPEEGAALVFFQPNLLHEGQPLRAGEKWLLRTDVMFRRNALPSAVEDKV